MKTFKNVTWKPTIVEVIYMHTHNLQINKNAYVKHGLPLLSSCPVGIDRLTNIIPIFSSDSYLPDPDGKILLLKKPYI